MENFMLWGVVGESGSGSLSFFATRMQLQYINIGTRDMIDTMLTDLRLPGIEYHDWSILHFLNNYYAAAEEKVGSTEAWTDTWEITLKLTQPLPPELALPIDDQEICRTQTRDETWDGAPPSAMAPHLIVARFYNEKLFTRAIDLFSEIRESHGLKDPEVQDLLEAIKQHPMSSNVSAKPRSAIPMELIVALGMFDEASFTESGAQLAAQVAELIYELGATITWDEKANYLMEQQRHSRSPV